MTVSLIRAYAGFPSGSVTEFTAELEAALVAQGLANVAADNAVTIGSQTANTYEGTVAIAATGTSVVVTNSNVTVNSKIIAYVAQAVADGTLLRVERIVPGNGSFTIYGTAAATATTFIDWAIVNPHGATVRN
jgi:hypothetical protein